jgi:hypothetical protein
MSHVDVVAHHITHFGRASTRGANDATNKIREAVLVTLTNPSCPFFEDPVYGQQWTTLKDRFNDVQQTVFQRHGIPPETPYTFEQRGGRRNHSDFCVRIPSLNKELNEEFKFHSKSLSDLPQFLSLSETCKLLPASYADLFYQEWLDQVLEYYPELQPLKPTRQEYLLQVYKNKSSHPFFQQFAQIDKDTTATRYKAKAQIVKQSIQSFLEQNKDEFQRDLFEQKLKETQTNKEFLLYEDDRFTLDGFKPTELSLDKQKGVNVHRGNTLLVQTEEPGTTFKLLLRWRNGLGVLFPAWQIAVKRS